MTSDHWLVVAVAVAVLFIAALFLVFKRSRPHAPDYRALFIIGVTWIPLGLATGNNIFTILGVALMALGLANKGKWKEQRKWSDLDPKTKNLKIALLAILSLLLIAGLATYFLRASG
jgi:hypothetical protein